MANTIELLKKEKNQSELDKKQLQAKQNQLQQQLQHYQPGKLLFEANEKLLQEIEGYKLTISSLEGEILIQKKEIQQLNEDLSIAVLTIQTQNNYENAIFYDQLQPTTTSQPIKANLSLSFGKNREVLKSLYFDLSKKTMNNQSLSEALSEQKQLIKQLQSQHQQRKEENETLQARVTHLLQEKDEFTKSTALKHQEEIALKEALLAKEEERQRYEKQLQEITKRFTDYRIHSEQQRHDLQYQYDQCTVQLNDRTAALTQATQVLQQLQQQFQHYQEQTEQKEQNKEQMATQLRQELQSLQEKVAHGQELQQWIDQYTHIHQQNEKQYESLQTHVQQVETEKYELKGHIAYLTFHYQKEKEITQKLQEQLAEAEQQSSRYQQEQQQLLQAFQQLLITSKDLKISYEQAQQEIIQLHQEMTTLQQTKENMNTAILNCLLEERQLKQVITHQMEADSLLREQLGPSSTAGEDARGEFLGTVSFFPSTKTSTTATSTTTATAKTAEQEVMERIQRGDFDWLNDDQMIHSLLNESLSQSREIEETTQKRHQMIQMMDPQLSAHQTALPQEIREIVATQQRYQSIVHSAKKVSPAVAAFVPSEEMKSSSMMPLDETQAILEEATR